jgi:DNA-binding beta-propeller fold protein YncE
MRSELHPTPQPPPRFARSGRTAARGMSKPLVLLVALSFALLAFSWVLVFGMSGKKVTTPIETPVWSSMGVQGDLPGQFQQPRGVTGFPDGSFVVVDRAARVQLFAADGTPKKLWSMKEHDLGNPKGLCALPDGNLLMCDTHYGRVLKMTTDGKVLKIWGKPGHGPAQFTHPMSAVVNEKLGLAYVVEYGERNDRVQVFNLDGKYLKEWGSFGDADGQFQRPSGITMDADGNLYVADAVNHRIQKFDSDGKFLAKWGEEGREPGQLRYPYDIAIGPDGKLYVAEFNNHRISIFERDGKFVRCFGSPGAAPGEFANPWSLGFDARGRLLVSDTGNHRVQIFDVMHEQTSKTVIAAAPTTGRKD